MLWQEFAPLEAVKELRFAGETACATKTSPVLALVGQTVSSALPPCGHFFHSFLRSWLRHEGYQVARRPRRICRSPEALVICMNVPDVTLVLTPPKCEVFAKLKNSPRNWALKRS